MHGRLQSTLFFFSSQISKTINRCPCPSRNPFRHLPHLDPSRDHRQSISDVYKEEKKRSMMAGTLTDKIVRLRPSRDRWWRPWWTRRTRGQPLFFHDTATATSSDRTIRPSISENAGGGRGRGCRRRGTRAGGDTRRLGFEKGGRDGRFAKARGYLGLGLGPWGAKLGILSRRISPLLRPNDSRSEASSRIRLAQEEYLMFDVSHTHNRCHGPSH